MLSLNLFSLVLGVCTPACAEQTYGSVRMFYLRGPVQHERAGESEGGGVDQTHSRFACILTARRRFMLFSWKGEEQDPRLDGLCTSPE